MAALVYQVSCGSRGHLWFADGVEAEAAAQEILRGGEAVGLFPVSVPETAREFVEFISSHRQRRPFASGGVVQPSPVIYCSETLPCIITEHRYSTGSVADESASVRVEWTACATPQQPAPEVPQALQAGDECGARTESATGLAAAIKAIFGFTPGARR